MGVHRLGPCGDGGADVRWCLGRGEWATIGRCGSSVTRAARFPLKANCGLGHSSIVTSLWRGRDSVGWSTR
jgi:hypothetical protein